MMNKGNSGLLLAMLTMSAASAYKNAYEGLTDSNMPYSRSFCKLPLTKKQAKSRAKAKSARKARKIQGRNK